LFVVPLRDWSFLSLGFLGRDENLLYAQHPPGPLWVMGGRRTNTNKLKLTLPVFYE
jgi:hypothetical protein